MKAYITVLSTNEYLDGVLGLYQSLLNVGAKYPLVVAITSKIEPYAREVLDVLGIEIVELPDYAFSEKCYRRLRACGKEYWYHTAAKLQIFGLTQYEKLVFLDSDMVVMRNIDELFEKPHMTAAIDSPQVAKEDMESHYQLNSGLMVIVPDKIFEEKLKEIAAESTRPDQDIIRLSQPDWLKQKELHLSVEYNYFMMFFNDYLRSGVKVEDVKVFHFIGKDKPFLCAPSNKKITITENYIEKYYLSCIKQATETFKNLKNSRK